MMDKSSFFELDSLNTFEPIDGLKGKLIHTDNQTVVIWTMKAGTILPAHHHVHEQVTILTKGELEFTIDGITKNMTAGMVANIPSNAVHSARAITDCEITDTFYPAREDYQ